MTIRRPNRIISPALLVTALALASLLMATCAAAQVLVAKVDTKWSPYVSMRVDDPSGLVGEVRELLSVDPGRVTSVLIRSKPTTEEMKRLYRGLRADALYQQGGNALYNAQRIYREIINSEPEEAESSWANFMDGNIKKVTGSASVARVAYHEALISKREWPWSPALTFNLGSLEVETGNYAEAIPLLERWLGLWGDKTGSALCRYLLAEAYSNTRQGIKALDFLDSAASLDPDVWIARPGIAFSLMNDLEKAGRLTDAALMLGKIPGRYPGTVNAGRARLAAGKLWEDAREVAKAAASYAQLVDEGPLPDDEQEARLRLAFLGLYHAEKVELTQPYPAFKNFYRPQEILEVIEREGTPDRQQRAIYGLAELSRFAGHNRRALEQYSQVFRLFTETAMSGLAYERFMDLLEKHMAEKMAAAEYLQVVSTFEFFREASKWALTRDRGAILAYAAEGYRKLGAPQLSHDLYESALYSGTRAVPTKKLREYVARAKVGIDEPGAIDQWLKAHPKDAEVKLKLARAKKVEGKTKESRELYLDAAALFDDPLARLEVLREADLLLEELGDLDQRIAAAQTRSRVAEKATGKLGAEERGHSRLVEARLRFASGQYGKAVGLFTKLDALAAEDSYLLALSHRALKQNTQARELFTTLTEKADDIIIVGLARLHLDVMDMQQKESVR
jgi:tetratricopeptide (TPR) repeat protein